ncbi:unnamed protein product [Closterium sp. NIES-64]|nr:unnamed protein product [Closterium sp. NIES-64]
MQAMVLLVRAAMVLLVRAVKVLVIREAGVPVVREAGSGGGSEGGNGGGGAGGGGANHSLFQPVTTSLCQPRSPAPPPTLKPYQAFPILSASLPPLSGKLLSPLCQTPPTISPPPPPPLPSSANLFPYASNLSQFSHCETSPALSANTFPSLLTSTSLYVPTFPSLSQPPLCLQALPRPCQASPFPLSPY